MLVTFEGVEGSGKTTQIELLCTYLTEKGYGVVKTREPGGTAFGEALRKVSLERDLKVLPFSELLVFMAIRAQHVEEIIIPALQEGKIVICDRFVDATYAYQGYGRDINLGIIETLNRLVTKGIRPNLTILLNCTPTVGLKRKATTAGHKTDRFEIEDLSFHKKIQKAYLKLAKEDEKRFFVVDGKAGITKVHEIVRDKVDKLLEHRGIQ
jgi:dTMP kinase